MRTTVFWMFWKSKCNEIKKKNYQPTSLVWVTKINNSNVGRRQENLSVNQATSIDYSTWGLKGPIPLPQFGTPFNGFCSFETPSKVPWGFSGDCITAQLLPLVQSYSAPSLPLPYPSTGVAPRALSNKPPAHSTPTQSWLPRNSTCDKHKA